MGAAAVKYAVGECHCDIDGHADGDRQRDIDGHADGDAHGDPGFDSDGDRYVGANRYGDEHIDIYGTASCDAAKHHHVDSAPRPTVTDRHARRIG
jgi:hypothetical protein